MSRGIVQRLYFFYSVVMEVDALKAKLAVAFPYCEAFGGAKATKRA